ncbi:MAG: FkbM family methyltransferase [Pseudomonadota bacterium]
MKQALINGARSFLPRSIRRKIFSFGYHVDRESFEEFSFLYGFTPNMELGLKAVAERGLAPKTVLDVGAFKGEWSQLAREIWPDAAITMFEPNADRISGLSDVASSISADLRDVLLGADFGKEVTFYVMDSGSSVLPENSPLEREEVTKSLSTLDHECGSQTSEHRDTFIKADAQGFELEILRGGKSVLERSVAVLLEVALIEINAGAPLLDEVVEFMKGHGFVSYEILGIHRRPLDKAMNQVDILFVHQSSDLLENKSHFKKEVG